LLRKFESFGIDIHEDRKDKQQNQNFTLIPKAIR